MTGAALDIPATEHGTVYVFALNLDDASAKPWREGETATIAAGFGLDTLDPKYAEVIRPRDMQPMKLSQYLTEGIGLPKEAVSPDRARLDSLSGHVVLLLSGAFGGRSVRLTPSPDVTHIGTYSEPPVMPSFERLSSEGASGRLGALEESSPPAATRGRGAAWIIALSLAAAAAAFLVLSFFN